MKISNVIVTSFFFLLLVFSIGTYQNYLQQEQRAEEYHSGSHLAKVVIGSNEFQRIFFGLIYDLGPGFFLEDESLLDACDSALCQR